MLILSSTTNCLSVFDQFMGLALKGLGYKVEMCTEKMFSLIMTTKISFTVAQNSMGCKSIYNHLLK